MLEQILAYLIILQYEYIKFSHSRLSQRIYGMLFKKNLITVNIVEKGLLL